MRRCSMPERPGSIDGGEVVSEGRAAGRVVFVRQAKPVPAAWRRCGTLALIAFSSRMRSVCEGVSTGLSAIVVVRRREL